MLVRTAPMTRLLLLSMACVAPAVSVAAAAPDAHWSIRTSDAFGRSEADGCAKARARAAEEARRYQGLNIRDCSCAPVASKGDGPTAGYRCRLVYEVLVRTGSS